MHHHVALYGVGEAAELAYLALTELAPGGVEAVGRSAPLLASSATYGRRDSLQFAEEEPLGRL